MEAGNSSQVSATNERFARSYDYSSYLKCQSHPKHLKNPHVTILKEILKEKIKLDRSEEAENNAIYGVVLEPFFEKMKECDETFNLLFNRVHYTGSYYSDLRISNSDEFDLDLVLKLPFRAHDLEVELKEEIASYGKLRLKYADPYYSSLLRRFFIDEYLIPERIRFWFHSVVDKALLHYPPTTRCVPVRERTADPARTVTITKLTGEVIYVDLVPVIEFAITKRIPGMDANVYYRVMRNCVRSCFLIPKPYSPTDETIAASRNECNQLWRLHFPDVESEVIHDFGCVKPVIKLLKLLRDKNDWKILASYYLKTVVMWLILEYPCKGDWREDKMGDKLIETLKRLTFHVENRNIPYFFCSPNNLIAKMSYDQSVNISYRLKRIIRNIEADPFNLWEEFGVQPTFRV